MNKPTNPERVQDKQDEAEVKNYTRTANMLIFGYREVSPQEKWLYVCLKHLCGKRGTRYLSLRYISEQTGISVGALSISKDKKGNINEGMIRHLHNAGLIHAEIKKKDGKNNAQYHITITDVWALNQAFFLERKTARSDFGQDEEETPEPVRISDRFVRISDRFVRISDKRVQISDEPVRIPGQYQDYSKTNYKIIEQEEDTYTERESQSHDRGAIAPTHTLVSPSEKTQGETDGTFEQHHLSANSARMGGNRSDTRVNSLSADRHSGGTAETEQHPHSQTVTPVSAPEPAPQAQLSTVAASFPQARAKVEKKPRKDKTTKYQVYFSLEGENVRSWEESRTGIKLDETAANARACNALGQKSGMSQENYTRVWDAIEANKWVRENDVVVTIQDLASPDGKLRWEKWLPVAMRANKKPTSGPNKRIPTRAEDPYSIAALLEEQNPGYHARKAEMEAALWTN